MNRDLIKFGMEEEIFSVESLLDLIYGKVECTYSNKEATFWWRTNTFEKIPEEDRYQTVKLALTRALKESDTWIRYNPFRMRTKCLWYSLLHKTNYLIDNFISENWRHFYIPALEVLLWYKWGLPLNQEEKELEQSCWKKFLGDKPHSRKQTLDLLRNNIADMKPVIDKLEHDYADKAKDLERLNQKSKLGLRNEKQQVQQELKKISRQKNNNATTLAFMLAEYDALTGNRTEI